MFAAGNKAGAISIHALLAESDLKTPPQGSRSRIFLSTLSLRRATRLNNPVKIEVMISIHALLAESDEMPSECSSGTSKFLSTLSLRRATCQGQAGSAGYLHFYPRSPCGERLISQMAIQAIHNFYPRSPCGERPASALPITSPTTFLSTLSLRRATKC